MNLSTSDLGSGSDCAQGVDGCGVENDTHGFKYARLTKVGCPSEAVTLKKLELSKKYVEGTTTS